MTRMRRKSGREGSLVHDQHTCWLHRRHFRNIAYPYEVVKRFECLMMLFYDMHLVHGRRVAP